mgnify:CR=1 FL=1
MQTVEKFLDDWKDDALGLKPAFASYFHDLVQKEDVEIEFNERPGISYSLRGIHTNDKSRPIFVMIDCWQRIHRQTGLILTEYGVIPPDILRF